MTEEDRDSDMDRRLREWGDRELSAAGMPVDSAPRPRTRFAGSRVILPAATAAAVLIAATGVAMLVRTAPRDEVVGSGGSILPATSTAAIRGPVLPAQDSPPKPDGVLTVTAVPGASPQLTREQAEVIMVNSFPPPPLLDSVTAERGFASEVTWTLGRVERGPVVAEFVKPVPTVLELAWVASWVTPDRSADCSENADQGKGGGFGYATAEGSVRPYSYVLAADGSMAFSYTGPSTGCRVPNEPIESYGATTQRAVNRISVPWTADTRDPSGDVLMAFDKPICATASGLGNEDGWLNFVEVPVGEICPKTVRATIRTGPTAPPHHPFLGPFRSTDKETVAPALRP